MATLAELRALRSAGKLSDEEYYARVQGILAGGTADTVSPLYARLPRPAPYAPVDDLLPSSDVGMERGRTASTKAGEILFQEGGTPFTAAKKAVEVTYAGLPGPKTVTPPADRGLVEQFARAVTPRTAEEKTPGERMRYAAKAIAEAATHPAQTGGGVAKELGGGLASIAALGVGLAGDVAKGGLSLLGLPDDQNEALRAAYVDSFMPRGSPARYMLESIGDPEAVGEAARTAAETGAKVMTPAIYYGPDAIKSFWEKVTGDVDSDAERQAQATAERYAPKVDDAAPIETKEQWLLRLAGAISSTGFELLEQAPIGGGQTLGSAVGLTPEAKGYQTQGLLMNLLERLEVGRGFMDDTGELARQHGYGPETTIGKAAAIAGLAADVLFPDELILKPFAIASKGAKFSGVASKIPAGGLVNRAGLMLESMRQRPRDVAETLRPLYAEQVVAGKVALDDLPPTTRKLMSEMLGAKPLDELAAEAGVLPRKMPEPEEVPSPKRATKTKAAVKPTKAGEVEMHLEPEGDLPPVRLVQEIGDDGRLRIKSFDSFGDAGEITFSTDTAWDSLIYRTLLGRPRPVDVTMTAPQALFVDTMTRATQAVLRATHGESALVLVGAKLVTRAERTKILDEVKETLGNNGVDIHSVKGTKAKDGVAVSPDQAIAWQRLADRYGVPVEVQPETTGTTLNSIRNAVVRTLTRDVVESRFLARGAPGFLLQASKIIEDAYFDEQGHRRMTKAGTPRGDQILKWKRVVEQSIGNAVRMVYDLDYERLPQPLRIALEKHTRKLTRTMEDLVDTFETEAKVEIEKGALPRDPLHIARFIASKHFRPITLDEFETMSRVQEVVKKLEDEERLVTPEEVFPLRDEILARTSERALGPWELGLRASDPATVWTSVQAWRTTRRAEAISLARVAVESYFAPAVHQVKERGATKSGMLATAGSVSPVLYGVRVTPEIHTAKVPTNVMLALYKEWWLNGNMDAPIVKTVLNTVAGPRFQSPSVDATIQAIMALKASEALGDAVEALSKERYIEPIDSPVALAVRDILADRHIAWTDEGLAEIVHPEHIMEQAWQRLHMLGFDERAPRPVSPMEVGKYGRDIDATVFRLLRKARDAGAQGIAAMGSEGVVATATRAGKEWVTHGFIIPSVLYQLGNLIGSPFISIMTIGLTDTVRAQMHLGNPRNWAFAGSLMLRLDRAVPHAAGLIGMRRRFAPRDVGHAVMTMDDGRILTLDGAEAMIKQFGVDTSRARTESATNFIKDIALESKGTWNWLLRKGGDWQGVVREVDGSLERVHRIGVFLAQMKRGAEAQDAARMARESIYDYSRLTAWERSTARMYFLFYTFQKLNAEAMLKALANNPSRLLGQLRFFRDQQKIWGITDEQSMAMQPKDIGRIVLGEDESYVYRADGSFDTRSSSMMSLSALIPTPEGLFLLYNLVNLMTAGSVSAVTGATAASVGKREANVGSFQESAREIAQSAHPLLNVLVETLSEVKANGWKADSYSSNEVPTYLAEAPVIGPWLQHMFSLIVVPISEATTTRTGSSIAGKTGLYRYVIPKENKKAQYFWRRLSDTLMFGREITGRDSALARMDLLVSHPWFTLDHTPGQLTDFEVLEAQVVPIRRAIKTQAEAVRLIDEKLAREERGKQQLITGRQPE